MITLLMIRIITLSYVLQITIAIRISTSPVRRDYKQKINIPATLQNHLKRRVLIMPKL